MKKTLALLLLAATLAGCTTRTEFGDCIGVADKEDSSLRYKLSAWNVALAIVFVETVVVPVVVAVDEAKCPVAKETRK